MTVDAILRRLLQAARVADVATSCCMHCRGCACWSRWRGASTGMRGRCCCWRSPSSPSRGWHGARRDSHRSTLAGAPARRATADMEDSADSAVPRYAGSTLQSPLQRLQRARLQERARDPAPPPDLREPVADPALMLSAITALAVIAAIVLWPSQRASSSDGTAATSPGATAQGRIAATGRTTPRYPPTRLHRPAGATAIHAGREGARRHALQWTLHFAPMPAAAELVFHDGQPPVAATRWRRLDRQQAHRQVGAVSRRAGNAAAGVEGGAASHRRHRRHAAGAARACSPTQPQHPRQRPARVDAGVRGRATTTASPPARACS